MSSTAVAVGASEEVVTASHTLRLCPIELRLFHKLPDPQIYSSAANRTTVGCASESVVPLSILLPRALLEVVLFCDRPETAARSNQLWLCKILVPIFRDPRIASAQMDHGKCSRSSKLDSGRPTKHVRFMCVGFRMSGSGGGIRRGADAAMGSWYPLQQGPTW
ncbi:hypothetical protein BD410DRAFT_193835 [Rickenella mellea]|uniref:Uncharacterized protein n=1 Tax=Rickenella mellea TaxID=50990 RepID=A0A4Y7Q557_9AGAM|nr:hypothetical protein BD410DRAFT_193835 [Rickenella mellea]